MLLAVSELDPTLRVIILGAAIIFFGLAAFGYSWGKLSLVAAGLGLFAFPFFWDALVAA
ncbi:MAG: hypothetical protein ACRD2C_02065 [Acidimicrobiales bacterium]